MVECCPFCGNCRLHTATARYIHQMQDELLVVEDVPCTRCDFCGEEYFDVAILKRIEAEHLAIIRKQRAPRRILPTAVEPFAALGCP